MDTVVTAHIWNTARIPTAARGLGLHDYPDLPKELLQQAEQFVDTFRLRHLPPGPRGEESYPLDRSLLGVGMTLTGPAGRGKTSLACAIATDVALRYHDTVFFVTAADYITAFFNRYGALVPETDREAHQTVVRRASSGALLILDDMGSENLAASGAAQSEFNRLLRHRFNTALPTIITSNLGPTGWSECYGPAAASFLHQAAPLLSVTGPDLRRGR